MIAPLTPMRLKAILWYQGEENDHATDACGGPAWYRCLFPAMISYWRRQFKAPALPFFYVYKGFDIILHRISRTFQHCTTPHAPCSALSLGAMRVGC